MAYLILIISLLAAGCEIPHIAHQDVGDAEIANLESIGFVTVGAQNIADMQKMVRPIEICKNKDNVCGLDAGISAGFLLKPREAFYDTNNPPAFYEIDTKTRYPELIKDFPIIRPKAFKKESLGIFPKSLADFWSRSFKNYKAKALAFDSFDDLSRVAKDQIKEGKPVLVMLRVWPQGRPVFLPDDNLGGIRTFPNSHWVVLVGFSENNGGEWLIRDNGGLQDTINYSGLITYLIKISNASLKNLTDNSKLSNELKLYIGDPNLPIFLDDWKSSDDKAQLQEEFKDMKAYNIVVFEKR